MKLYQSLGVILLLFAVCGSPSVAMIPWIANDFGASPTVDDPELVRLVDAEQPHYFENLSNYGDAASFPQLERYEYLGFSNSFYGGPSLFVPAVAEAWKHEEIFYHSTDPSSLAGWREAGGVTLHWDWDNRFVYGGTAALTQPPTEQIRDFVILRTVATDSIFAPIDTVYGTNSFVDTSADGGTAYSYMIESLRDGVTYSFTAADMALTVGTTINTRPRFWLQRQDYQERIYHTLLASNVVWGDTTISFPVVFGVAATSDPSLNCTLEIFHRNTYGENESGLLPPDPTIVSYAGGSYDAGTGTLVYTVSFPAQDFHDYGGLVYRLRYDDPQSGQTSYLPEIRDGKNHLYWSSLNNRVMGCSWNNYHMNIENAVWRDWFVQIALEYGSGAASTGVAYDGIMIDTVIGRYSKVYNVNRPYEYTNRDAYSQATEDFLISASAAITDAAGPQLFLNSQNWALNEALEGADFAGFLNDNWTSADNWNQYLLPTLWMTHAHPNWTTWIMQNEFDFNRHLRYWSEYEGRMVDDYGTSIRNQALAAFLITKSATVNNSLFGYGEWKVNPGDLNPAPDFLGRVNLLPEQMLGLGAPLLAPFDPGFVWPSAADITAWSGGTGGEAVDWLAANADSLIYFDSATQHSFAVREYELDIGMPDSLGHLMAIVDVASAPDSVQVTLSGILGGTDKWAGQYYRLDMENDIALLVEGAGFGTTAVAGTEPWATSTGKAVVFSDHPIATPAIKPTAEYALIRDPSLSPVLAVRASHWNGMPLDTLRVDGSNLGWSSEIYLWDDGDSNHGDAVAGDGLYSYRGAPLSMTGDSADLPIVATGSDGLMKFASVQVKISEHPGITFVDGSDSTADLNVAMSDTTFLAPESHPTATAAFDYDGDGAADLFVGNPEGGSGMVGGKLFRRSYLNPTNGVPAFADVTKAFSQSGAFANYVDLPYQGHQSAAFGFSEAAADSVDTNRVLFLAHPDPARLRLYRWTVSGADAYFSDGTEAMIPFRLDDIYDAAWQDFNNDGLTDLAVARAPSPSEGSAATGGAAAQTSGDSPSLVFRQNAQHQLIPAQLDSLVYMPMVLHFAYDINWCNVDGSGTDSDVLPDLFIPDLWDSGPATLLINKGVDPTSGVTTFADETNTWFPGGTAPRGVRSAVLIDLDGDNDEDLVTASWSQPDNLAIYRNTGSSFELVDKDNRFIPVEPYSLNGVAVADFNGTGIEDIFVAPQTDWGSSYLLVGGDDGSMSYSRFSELSMGTSAVHGMALADWGGDGDPDAFLCRRADAGQFFFKTEPAAGKSANPWVKVSLRGGGGENARGLGATIAVLEPGFETARVLQTKRGMVHSPAEVVMHLPGYAAGTVQVQITWQSGHVQTETCQMGQNNTIQDDSHEIVPGSVTSFYRPGPLGTDWGVSWVTRGPTLPGNDQVVFYGTTNMSDPCFCGGTVVLRPGSTHASFTIERVAEGWKHTMIWQDGCCLVQKPACTTTYEASSSTVLGTGNSGVLTFAKFKVCGSGF